jgi:hypothetical protein
VYFEIYSGHYHGAMAKSADREKTLMSKTLSVKGNGPCLSPKPSLLLNYAELVAGVNSTRQKPVAVDETSRKSPEF